MAHQHDWHLPDGPYMVIDTFPEQLPYICECGAFTHDPETGEPCRMCNPVDWERRTTDLVRLSGGPFNGVFVARPVNNGVYFRTESKGRPAQMIVRYEPSESDSDVWEFRGNTWTHPLKARETQLAEAHGPAIGS
jgi:hypothetical protein